MAARRQKAIRNFNFKPGRVLAGKYEVIAALGSGWEGEVYLVEEKDTGIERAAKFFYPQRNPNNRSLLFYAKKLHKLRNCPILIQYHTQDTVTVQRQPVKFIVSDYVEGDLLSNFIEEQPGQRLDYFQGLHLLYTLAQGIESIHHMGEYHGDLHTDNIIVQRAGLAFEVKLVDMYHWGAPTAQNIRQDVFDLVRILYDVLGGQRHYARQPQPVKSVINGLKRTLILKKFKTAGQLREYLENLSW